MSGITHTQSQAVRSPRSTRLRTAAIVAAVVAAFALAAVLALVLGNDGTPAADTAQPAAVESSAIVQPGIRYDGGPEEGSWRVVAPNSGRPDGGPEEGTRGPGH
jgi:hypothetical protein